MKDLDQCDSICTLEYKLDEWENEKSDNIFPWGEQLRSDVILV